MGEWFERHRVAVALVVSLVFAGMGVGLVQAHEPWYDEMVPWILSEEITVQNYYEVNSVEPHPPLWQLILALFSQNNVSPVVLGYISLALVTIAVFLMWKHAPFNVLVQLILTFSAVFFYYNPVIARSYSLIPLAVVLLAMAWKGRFEHPLRYGAALAFLLQTHFLMWGLAGVMAVEFGIGCIKKKLWTGLLGAGVIAGTAVLVCLPTIISCMGEHVLITGLSEVKIKYAWYGDYLNLTLFGVLIPIFEVTFGLIFLYLLAYRTKWFVIMLASILYMWLTMTVVYLNFSHMEQKAAAFLAVVLFIFWAVREETADYSPNKLAIRLRKWFSKIEIVKLLRYFTEESVLFFCLPFLFSIPQTINMSFRDIHGPYDDSTIIAAALNQYPEASVFIMGSGTTRTFAAAIPFLGDGRQFYEPLPDNYGLDVKLNSDFYKRLEQGFSDEKLQEVFDKLSEKHEHIYYITSRPSCANAEPSHADVLREYQKVGDYTSESYMRESTVTYLIYQIK